jgi:TonB family protein
MSKLVFNLCLALTLSLWQPEMLLIANAQKRAPGKQVKRNQKINYLFRPVRCELLPGIKEAWKRKIDWETLKTPPYDDRQNVRPAPSYPPEAKAARISGLVEVKITIDKLGRVIVAQALEGPPLLLQAAVEAACRNRYDPDRVFERLEVGQEKTDVTIRYHFILQ